MNKSYLYTLSALSLSILFSAFLPKKGPKLPGALSKQFVHVPEGPVIIENDSLFVASFYVGKYEVTNAQYQEFLQSTKDNDTYKKGMIDTTVWNEFDMKNDPFSKYYHTHPAYLNYPAVGMSKEGAMLYCSWLEQQLNSDEENNVIYHVTLPTRNQLLHVSQLDHYANYAWGNDYLANSKSEYKCNFRVIGEENIVSDEQWEISKTKSKTRDFRFNQSDFTAPVTSYTPNEIEVYNLNGNVAEMTQDNYVCGGSWIHTGYDVRNESFINYVSPAAYIGFRPIITVTTKQQ